MIAPDDLNDDQLLRYSRQIMLPEIGIEGQAALLNARVVIVGLGALGSPASLYLATSGVGELVLVDHDRVELSNLQRQIVHATDNVGADKVESAARTLRALNPEIVVTPRSGRFEDQTFTDDIARADAVLDCTDNFAVRFALNRVCFEHRTPLISGAAIRMEGQVSVFDFRDPHSPCYHCLYPESGELEERCAQTGVLGAVAGVIGSIQAAETVKVLLGIGKPLTGRLLLLDARGMEIQVVRLNRDPDCQLCGVKSLRAAHGRT